MLWSLVRVQQSEPVSPGGRTNVLPVNAAQKARQWVQLDDGLAALRVGLVLVPLDHLDNVTEEIAQLRARVHLLSLSEQLAKLQVALRNDLRVEALSTQRRLLYLQRAELFLELVDSLLTIADTRDQESYSRAPRPSGSTGLVNTPTWSTGSAE
jgi:hypothetical protein